MTSLSHLSVLASAHNSCLLASNSALNSAGLPPQSIGPNQNKAGSGQGFIPAKKNTSDLETGSGNSAVLYIQRAAKSSDRDQKGDWCCVSLSLSVRYQRLIALDSRKDRVTVIRCHLCILQHQGCAQPPAKLRAFVSPAGFTLSWHTSSPPPSSSHTMYFPQSTPMPSTLPLLTHSPTGTSLTYMFCLPAPLLTPAPTPTLAPALPLPPNGPCTDP